jgi:ketosteroid isomerase-like protein
VTAGPDDEPDPVHRLVRRWARAVNERDEETLVALSDPDISLNPMQVGVSGHYRGHEGLRQWVRDLVASELGHEVRFRGIRTLEDGRVALFGEVFLGDTSISSYSLLVTVRDDRVAGTRSYLSDEQTLEQLNLLG